MITNTGLRTTFQKSDSEWLKSLSLDTIKCLIVCRGPVRMEAIQVFDEIGIKEYGILLSEKDSIVYPMALAPELRSFKYLQNVHRVPDYMGAGQEEKLRRIDEIIEIAKSNQYTHIFAGYGFMAEDAEFIEAIEKSGITFMGPASSVAKQAGAKDEAKKIARKIGVSVTPGIDMISAIALSKKVTDKQKLESLAKSKSVTFSYDEKIAHVDNCEALLVNGYAKLVEFVTIEELQTEALVQSETIWKEFPKNRIRFKYIGGGGGKGQRVISSKDQVKDAVMEILAESKVLTPGSNRNFLIELNIENTRHNEIQLVGNGTWTIALGGRDCSLQMHEQKLLEISSTTELLKLEIEKSKTTNPNRAKVLETDLKVLQAMETESEKFGQAVNLDSVSTFECIVDGDKHFFMEMNTRIQVEHRVTEMCYSLKFVNPKNKNEYFIVDSLIETMALLSLHGKKLDRPERINRNVSGAEVRINATNQSLAPHAGGVIQNWSPPIEHEIRDDQGIGTRDPDTGMFIHYRLAGAYDSNIALLVSYGESRNQNLHRLSNILRRTVLRGHDLQTNLPVHYGLINWILGHDEMFKPNTRFMMSYLAGIGSIQSVLRDVDLEVVWEEFQKTTKKKDEESLAVLNKKLTFLLRPLKDLFASPHVLGGFLGRYNNVFWKVSGNSIQLLGNPLDFLNVLYEYMNLDDDPQKDPCHKIWANDLDLLTTGHSFYKDLNTYSGLNLDFETWDKAFQDGKNPSGSKLSADLFEKAKASHLGFQVGMDLLKIIPKVGIISGFFGISMDEHLDPIIPKEFSDADSIKEKIKSLNPPPKAKSDEIVAPMGGMFYSKEAPNLPQMVQEGDHFKAGQPLFIIEVMKMFNKISVPYSGTIVKSLLPDSDGKIVTKAQPIFKIEPDEKVHEETAEEVFAKKQKMSLSLLNF